MVAAHMNTENQKYQDLVSSAYEVFLQEGIHGTGIDHVLKGTGISKRTLYKHFRSKDELVLGTLELYHRQTMDGLTPWFANPTMTTKDKILGIFDIKKKAADEGKRLGCYSMSVRMEYEKKNNDIEIACLQFTQSLITLMTSELIASAHADPENLAMKMMILLQGAMVISQFTKNSDTYAQAKEAAACLLDSYTTTDGT
jgi:AcrR family transcriptional regulator